MPRPVAAGVDGSPESLAAAGWAAREAVRRGLPLWLVYADETLPTGALTVPRERAEELLDRSRALLSARHPGLKLGDMIMNGLDTVASTAALLLFAVLTVRADWRMWFNAAPTLLLMVLLILEVADLVVLFMAAFAVALLVNIRAIDDQQELIKRQAANPVPVMMLVLAAGIFTGIMTDAGMIKAMADAALSIAPGTWGAVVPLFTAQKTALRWGVPVSSRTSPSPC
ncbi:universal stress protein [Streptomyces daliensis]